jgi:hypothetical protein
MDRTFLQARITATKAQIIAYETAIDAIVAGGVASYTLDTGQTNQTVTKLNLAATQRTLDSLYNRCATMETRLNGTGVVMGRPAW